MTKLSKAREKLVDMYIKALEEDEIPWRSRWKNGKNVNGITNKEYKGMNQLILSYVAKKEQYKDCRWLTHSQIKKCGYKLQNAKGKGVPIEFWNVYDIKNRKSVDFETYEKAIEEDPSIKINYKVYNTTTSVFNGDLIQGLPELKVNQVNKKIKTPQFILNVIKNMKVKYTEYGDKAYYNPRADEIVLPPSELFIDKYSYYATQLHEICHASGSESRLHRSFDREIKNYAREELIAEISSSFLMQDLNIDIKAEHYDNHKSYIKSWIKILKNNPQELFNAINEAKNVCKYVKDKSKVKTRENER